LSGRGTQIDLCRKCPDWKYRSWKHNYWKIVDQAEQKRQQKLQTLDLSDAEGYIADDGEEAS
jgi:hypothetical protein